MKQKSHYTLLLIDDDPTLRLIADKKLSQQGYQVVLAATGQEGVQAFIDHSPDLLLLDYELPDMSGVEVCRNIRSYSDGVEKPILFITGKDDFLSIEKAFQAGATDFSSKPLNWNVLFYRIRYMLRSHEIYLSLLLSETQLRKSQKIAKLANWGVDSDDHAINWSDTFDDILDGDASHFTLEDFLQRVPDKDRVVVEQAFRNCIDNNRAFEIEHELVSLDGTRKIISHLGNVVKNNALEIVDHIGTMQDITERRHIETTIRKLSYFDSLTGLMNREAFLGLLDRILASNTENNRLSALLFIDLDDFKRVNDTLGHNYGDFLLCEVSERLKQCVRTVENEKEFAIDDYRMFDDAGPDRIFRLSSLNIKRFDLCRLGGDEFTVFLDHIASENVAANVACRLLKVLEKPFYLDENEVYVTFSIGIAIAPYDGDSIQTLLKNADTAMYSTKSNGKNNYQFYAQTMNESYLDRLKLETDLRSALLKNELYIVYQPQYCMQTGALIGVEALMRWKHHARGEISPGEFIPLAEETGQILAIGDWLFEQCLNDLKHWKSLGLISEDFKLSLNVSALQFHQADILPKVKTIFNDPDLNKHIGFELTETVMMKNASGNLSKLRSLANHNITLSIDDFGTGYSSLSYLHQFPVDTVKIDKSFVDDMQNDGVSIVKAIIAMAHGMKIKVVAEGIETQWQYDFLKAESCDIGQGFFLAKPMTVQSFLHLLQPL